MLTDLQPRQRCTAIVIRFGGSAREMARAITPQEILNGVFRNGVQLDPASYTFATLQDRFAALDEETRLASMCEMLAFARRPGETVNALPARYEIVRQRAAIEGQFVMTVEGCALQILRACNVHANQLTLLLMSSPYQRFPKATWSWPATPIFRKRCRERRGLCDSSHTASSRTSSADIYAA